MQKLQNKIVSISPYWSVQNKANKFSSHDTEMKNAAYNKIAFVRGIEHLYQVEFDIDYHVYTTDIPTDRLHHHHVDELLGFEDIIQLLHNHYTQQPLLQGIVLSSFDKEQFKTLTKLCKYGLTNVDYVWISVYNKFIFTSIWMILTIQKYYPDVKIVVGGYTCSISSYVSDLFFQLGCIVSRGDLECLLIELIEHDTLQYRISNEYFDISTPNYIPHYKQEDFQRYPCLTSSTLYIQTSRGCYGKCKFCPSGICNQEKYEHLDTSIVDKLLHEYGENRKISFTDNNSYITLDRFKTLFQDKHYQLSAWITTLPFTDEVLSILQDNFFELLLEYKSFHPKINQYANMHYGNRYDEYVQELDQIYRIFKKPIYNTGILWLPSYTIPDIEYDLSCVQQIRKRYNYDPNMIISNQTYYVFPNTYIYNHPKEYNMSFKHMLSLPSSIPNHIQDILYKIPYTWYTSNFNINMSFIIKDKIYTECQI
jgi:hypothetical protein